MPEKTSIRFGVMCASAQSTCFAFFFLLMCVGGFGCDFDCSLKLNLRFIVMRACVSFNPVINFSTVPRYMEGVQLTRNCTQLLLKLHYKWVKNVKHLYRSPDDYLRLDWMWKNTLYTVYPYTISVSSSFFHSLSSFFLLLLPRPIS